MFLCFMNSIHSKDIHSKIKSSFCKFLCFVSSTFNMCHIFISSIPCMFYVLGLFMKFFHSLSCNWLGGTSSETPSSESVKNVKA